ncbi:uncharacterized protein LOC111480388 [Cucurbita maxima]|uniref:Uncharacterized protein LOC111480388 n=1 Tax=Cucurbita maxima TaxID=3661 RepID=A0A6J1IVS1_CUCMA|nr:uncharacterized protein LOC111480388 [Cucurbita maxima]
MLSGGVGGGSVYWGSRNEPRICRGVVVLFAWVSIQHRHLDKFVQLYASLGWNSLVCYADFLNIFDPERATSLAFLVLNELVEELRMKLRPVVFVGLSGASKACMCRVLQIIEGRCGSPLYMAECQMIRACVSGHIYDSSPIELISDLGARFAIHPAVLKVPGSSQLISWLAKGVSSGLDALYLTRFDSQRDEYWRTLCSSVNIGAPFLIMCSEKDDRAPYKVICDFTKSIQELGADVQLVKFKDSPHLGHYKNYPAQYRAAVTIFLEKASSVYSHKIPQFKGERRGMEGDGMPELICDLQNAAVNSNQSFRRVAVGPSDHFFLPSSADSQDGREHHPPMHDQKERISPLSSPQGISAHSVLGQFLFDVCVPKNVEGWDIKFHGSLNGQPLASARRHSPFPVSKLIRRSRL